MATSVRPILIDTLIERLTPLMGFPVFDNYALTDADPETFLIVNSLSDDGNSGTSEQDWAYSNSTVRQETGTLNCVLYSRDGDGVAKTARDAVYAGHELIAEHLRATPTLGIPQMVWTSFATTSTFTQDSHEDVGSWAVLEFSIFFTAQL